MSSSEDLDHEAQEAKARFIAATNVDPDSDPQVQLALNLGAMARDLQDGLDPNLIGAEELRKALDTWFERTRSKIKRSGRPLARAPYYLDLVRRVVALHQRCVEIQRTLSGVARAAKRGKPGADRDLALRAFLKALEDPRPKELNLHDFDVRQITDLMVAYRDVLGLAYAPPDRMRERVKSMRRKL